MPGYQQSYVNDFAGTSLPSGWGAFSGKPGSDPGAQWATNHVQVSGGLLQLNTSQDSSYNNEWVSGGLCQCGHAQTYGAYFVRSKLTGPGPTQVELLWPTGSWPPEIDFNETYGATDSSMATVHYDANNDQSQQTVNIDLTQWHTWGVIWTPTSITYTVDGSVWGSVTVPSEIPNQPMTLDIQQQTWCSSGWACPTATQSTHVDWVAEYTAGSSSPVTTTTAASSAVTTTTTKRSRPVTTTTTAVSSPVTTTTTAVSSPVTRTTTQSSAMVASPVTHALVSVRPFPSNSSAISSGLKSQITNLAKMIDNSNDSKVSLVGFSDVMASQAKALAVSKARAVTVAKYLKRQLAKLKDTKVRISVAGDGSSHPIASNASSSGRALNRRVVARIG